MKKKFITLFMAVCLLVTPMKARADLFGGDVVVLLKILAESMQTVIQLKSILQNGQDTLNLLRDINQGVKVGLDTIRIINPKFDAGVYGKLGDVDSVLNAIQNIYGQVPEGIDVDLMKSQDQSVAEVISMNRNLYDYADQVDKERDRLLIHSQAVSPQGAAKLQNQALGVLIGVNTQLLRTQSQMLKLMAQNMAFDNRKEKIITRNFQENYKSVSENIKSLPKEVLLPRLKGGGL